MQFAVMTDIHGNYPALKAVLSEIDKQNSVEHIYCLGDMIGIGPDSNEVLETLFSRIDISMITGNHDEAIVSLAKGEPYPESHAHVREHHQWLLDRMDQSLIPKLDQLPRTMDLNIEGYSVLFIHYQIEYGKMNEHISKDPFRSIVEPSVTNLESLFKGHHEDLICFGHHHPIHYFKGNCGRVNHFPFRNNLRSCISCCTKQ